MGIFWSGDILAGGYFDLGIFWFGGYFGWWIFWFGGYFGPGILLVLFCFLVQREARLPRVAMVPTTYPLFSEGLRPCSESHGQNS